MKNTSVPMMEPVGPSVAFGVQTTVSMNGRRLLVENHGNIVPNRCLKICADGDLFYS
jgi:hypothetical protein